MKRIIGGEEIMFAGNLDIKEVSVCVYFLDAMGSIIKDNCLSKVPTLIRIAGEGADHSSDYLMFLDIFSHAGDDIEKLEQITKDFRNHLR